MLQSDYNLLTILGPTATGKTRVAACVAAIIDGEIISADSRQVYKMMDLGTGKDYDDYLVGKNPVPCHLIDIRPAGYKYNVYEFQNDFLDAYESITRKGKFPVLCGGTGMYIEAALKGYKLIAVPVNEPLREQLKAKSLVELGEMLAKFKNLHNTSDIDTKKRAIRAIEIETYYAEHESLPMGYPKFNPLYVGIQVDREIRRKRITDRLLNRLEQGMIAEVQLLLDEGILPEDLMYYGLEYKFITQHLTGLLDYNEMVAKLNTAIHQFAKRQMTWFRKMEREGINIHWVDALLPTDDKVNVILELLRKQA